MKILPPPEEPKDLREWLWRMKYHENGIFVREKVGGKWKNALLTELPPDRWAYHVGRWIEQGMVPAHIHNETVGD